MTLVEKPELEAPCGRPGCRYSIRIDGPADPLEISIDGAAYRPCRRVHGAWSLEWTGPLSDGVPTVVVVRKAAPESRSCRA